jgi:hypothetical protein
MNFLLQINWQIFRKLPLDDSFVFGKDLMIEIERGLQWRVFVKVAANRDKHTRLSRGHRRRGVQYMQVTIIGEEDGKPGCEGQPGFKEPPPFKAGRIKVFKTT